MKNFDLFYKGPHFGSEVSLGRYLSFSAKRLNLVAENIENHWRPGQRKIKPNGDIRITHSASEELKKLHKQINRKIFRNIDFPFYLNGGLPKGSDGIVRNHIRNAGLHLNKRVVINTDISNYFPSITAKTVHSLWQGFFCLPHSVSELLTSLTTYHGALPQGWGCSSYIAQSVFWDVEPKLAHSLRNQGINYSRLIDDITLSTNRTFTENHLTELFSDISKMMRSKGVRKNYRKTSMSTRGRRQSVNKLNLNAGRLTVPKDYRNRLRAQIHCYKENKNLDEESRKIELQSIMGKISYIRILNPKVARTFEQYLNSS